MSAPTLEPFLKPAVDSEAVQALVVTAALSGDQDALVGLPALLTAFDEPYRTAAEQIVRLHRENGYVDRNLLGAALGQRRLFRQVGNSRAELTPEQALALLGDPPHAPGQVAAYVGFLKEELNRRRRAEFEAEIQGALGRLAKGSGNPVAELEHLVTAARRSERAATAEHPTELLELLPYARDLEQRQRGCAFQGLDTGFDHVNYLCNGLDTGLMVLAARPGAGKTTLVWQVCCQVAEREKVPVIFISLEQSKRELRAKALARLGGLEYRHILRGRLTAGDTDTWPKVLNALDRYGDLIRHLLIVEGDENTTVEAIGEIAARRMEVANADRCLVAVDYLQIVPLAEKDVGRVTSPKDKVDLHVSAFRRLARQLNASVLCISSENRSGYKSKSLDVFKESGGIEYSADIAGVLTHPKAGTSAPAAADYRALDLNIVKNRNGECGVVHFKFYPRHARFAETGRSEPAPESDE
jgi:replicative DNA helicase